MSVAQSPAGDIATSVISARSGKIRVPTVPEFPHQLLERKAAEMPGTVAVVCGNRSLTFGDLNACANRLAWKLRALQVKPNTPVGICLDRSLELMVAIYGVLKAGGMYVPLDPAYPGQRLAYMVESVNAPVAISGEGLTSTFGSRVAHVISGSGLCEDAGHSENPPIVNTPSDLIYTIFTSGSTGRPKGAGVYHRGFANLLAWFREEFAIGAGDRSLLVSSFSFDLTQKNFFAAIGQGGALHLLPPGPYDPETVLQQIETNRITLLNCTPSAAYPLVEHEAGARLDRLSTLRCLFLGGEPISAQRLKAWTASPFCHATIVNTYGPTECSDICAFHRLTDLDLTGAHPVPLGQPIDNTTLAVIDEQTSSAGTGELWIAGEGVGAGYITDPTLTHEKFLANPNPDVFPGRVVYRSGDLVRWRADGALEFAGRADHQVKIRGFRVELGEVENALEQLPEIREAAAIARKATDEAAVSLVAYFVAADGRVLDAQAIRAALRERLPDHMVPGDFVQIEKLPLSPNGKVDRRALADREVVAAPVAALTRPDGLEQKIAAVWRAVLRVPEVSWDKNFFDLGGDSLQVIEVHLRLKSIVPGDQLSVTALFQYPTIESLCAFLRTAPSGAAAANAREERARKQQAAFARRPVAGTGAAANGKKENRG